MPAFVVSFPWFATLIISPNSKEAAVRCFFDLLSRPQRLIRTLLGLTLVCAANHVAHAEEAGTWSQFLGPQRNGISTETGLISTLPDGGPKVLWRADSGIGMSGIALDGKRAVTMVQGDGKQSVLALDANTGEMLWSTQVADAYRNSMGDGPRATPTIADGRVLTLTGNGTLAALDVDTGKLLWRHDLPQELGGQPAEYGMASSPLVVGDVVVVNAGAPGAAIVGYHAKTGEIAWKTGSDAAGYSSPALLNVGGKKQVVAFTGGAAWGLDPASGDQLWKYPYKTSFNCNVATPIDVNGNVFISAGENHGSAMLALEPDGAGFKTSEIWTSQGPGSVMRNEWQTSILLDGYLYGMDNVGGAGPITHLKCIHAKTGELAWAKLRFGKGNLIFADGKLFIVTMQGDLVLVRATPEKYEELARAKVLESTRQAPSLLGGKLYLRDVDKVICLDVSNR